MPYSPSRIGAPEIRYLIDTWTVTKCTNTVSNEISTIGKWMERMGKNTTVATMEIQWPDFVAKGAGWLPPATCATLLDGTEDSTRLALHLMLYLGFRRAEVLRFLVTDMDWDLERVLVRGKGHKGGKLRWVKFYSTTRKELEAYMRVRERRISEYRKKGGAKPVPPEMIIYSHWKTGLGAYKPTSMDKLIREMAEEKGVHFSAHSLRKSFARNHFLAGTKIEVISSLLGHADTKTTIRYLGIAQDDQAEAQSTLEAFMRGQK